MSTITDVHIFLTNDDSPRSPALQYFIKELRPHYKLTVVIPNIPRSGISKALSFNEPIRFIEGPIIEKQPTIETTGTPADAVTWCRTYFPSVNLVIAGPNLGLNVSAHSILTSGTVGAVIEAALWKMPAIAFSIESPSNTWFIPGKSDANYKEAASRAHQIIKQVLTRGLPQGISFLNVSFPGKVDETTQIEVAKPVPIRFINRLITRVDPHGTKYNWIIGKEKKGIPKNSDVFIATKESKIVISPISLALSDDRLIAITKEYFQPLMNE